MVDITYSIDSESGETTFSANSPAGVEFLGDTQRTVDNDEATSLIELAQEKGLTIVPFP
jgi:hypothetical protein